MCWREQSGVAERSDADDRLRSAMDIGSQIIFTEIERTLFKEHLKSFLEYTCCTEYTSDVGASSRE